MPMRVRAALRRAVGARVGEEPRLALSFACFLCLMCGYTMLRPVRDEMGIQGGVEDLPWVFTATFLAMLVVVPLFGATAARLPRRRLLPAVYAFLVANLLVFWALFAADVGRAWVARAFFVWVSVINLLAISVFWSLMADRWSNAQARRLFGVVAAGGSVGAVLGPALTAGLAGALDVVHLLPVSAALLGGAMACALALVRHDRRSDEGAAGDGDRPATREPGAPNGPLRGSSWAGLVRLVRSRYLLGIGGFLVLYTSLSTFLYFAQANIVAAELERPEDRTRLFAGMDLAVNALTVVAQLFATSRLVRRLGVPAVLGLVPAAVGAGFLVLGLVPTLTALVAFQVLRRAGEYAFGKPARELLFTVVPDEDKYKTKNVIDTVVYRGGDALSGWAFAGLAGLGLGLSAIALVAVPIAAVWAVLGVALGRRQEALCATARGSAPGQSREAEA